MTRISRILFWITKISEKDEKHENPFGQVETTVSDVVSVCFRL